MKFLKSVGVFLSASADHMGFLEGLDKDRERSCEELSELVASSTPAQLDIFVRKFLDHSVAVMGTARRQRAIELFAFLKILQMNQNGRFGGFIGPSGPL